MNNYERLAENCGANLAHEGPGGMRIWHYGKEDSTACAIIQHSKKSDKIKRGTHLRFGSVAKRTQWTDEQVEAARSLEAYRQEKREKAANHVTELKAGDIMVSSWGWEQTNVAFAQILEIMPSGKTAKARRIGSDMDREQGNSTMSSYVMPKKDSFLPDAPILVVRISPSDTFKIPDEHAPFSKWSGRPQYCSWYA